MYVIVQRSPVFTRTPHSLYLKKLGETVEIPCDAKDGENSHKPMIVWYKVSIHMLIHSLPFFECYFKKQRQMDGVYIDLVKACDTITFA